MIRWAVLQSPSLINSGEEDFEDVRDRMVEAWEKYSTNRFGTGILGQGTWINNSVFEKVPKTNTMFPPLDLTSQGLATEPLLQPKRLPPLLGDAPEAHNSRAASDPCRGGDLYLVHRYHSSISISPQDISQLGIRMHLRVMSVRYARYRARGFGTEDEGVGRQRIPGHAHGS